MNILILANHYPVASGRYAADALRRLGHTVWTSGPAHGRDVWGMTAPPDTVWTPAEMPYEARDSLDLVLVMDSDPAILDAARGWERRGLTPCVVWGVDNHVRDYRRPWISHYFVAHKEVSLMEWKDDMTWLPCAYDPTIFKPGPPLAERSIDVALIGVMYPHRRQAIAELKAAGLKVVAGMGLFGEAMADVYRNAKISLCLSAAHDLSQRVFETVACGCAVLTDPLPDLDWIVHPGLWTWDGKDLADSVSTVLSAPMLQAQVDSVMPFFMSGTWDARALQLLQTVFPNYQREKGQSNEPEALP